MSEEPTSTEETPKGEFAEELETLGQQLATAIKSLWESEESRKLRQQIREGFLELSRTVDAAIKSAQESESARQLSEQMKETIEKARQSEVVDKVEESLLTGLREMNERLARLIRSLEEKSTPPTPPEDSSQL